MWGSEEVARTDGPPLLAQVLNYPGTDRTETMTGYPSVEENAGNPTSSLSRLRAARRLSVPPALDTGRIAALDPLADHGRRYVERLRDGGTDARLTCYPRATAYLSTTALLLALTQGLLVMSDPPP